MSCCEGPLQPHQKPTLPIVLSHHGQGELTPVPIMTLAVFLLWAYIRDQEDALNFKWSSDMELNS